jgi:hypothetical protein
MNTISLNNLWSYLQGLSLTASNQRWLANHLMEAAESVEKRQRKAELVFPKIPRDYKPSAKVMAMTLGKLPEGVDLESELEERWQEWAR